MTSADDILFTTAPPEDDPQLLYEHAPCGYLTTDPEGLILRANRTFLAWTGFRAEDLVGQRRLSSLFTAGGRIYHDTHYAPMLLMQNIAREIALEVVTASGSRLPVLLNAALERDEAGDPRLVRIVMIDATERRKYEQELLRAKQRAEELARTLERTLLPPSLPDVPGLDVAAAYRPAGGGGLIGGDFYDVFQVAEDDWVAVLGDVCGKGVEAAVITALARHTIRAASVRLSDPRESLRVLDEVLRRDDTERFCTVALVRLRYQDGEWRVGLSLAGHLPPLLLEPGREARFVGEPGPLLGVLQQPSFTCTELTLGPDSCLVLFTDGIVEARAEELYGEERLIQTATRATATASTASSLVQAIVTDVLRFQLGQIRDDIAVLALRVDDGSRPGPS